MLYISGAGHPDKIKGTWYELISHGLASYPGEGTEFDAEHTTGNLQAITFESPATQNDVTPDAGLAKSIAVKDTIVRIAPSHTADHFSMATLPHEERENNDATDRGIAIHIMLDKLTIQPDYEFEKAATDISHALGNAPDDGEWQDF